jgi:hypothetical protein
MSGDQGQWFKPELSDRFKAEPEQAPPDKLPEGLYCPKCFRVDVKKPSSSWAGFWVSFLILVAFGIVAPQLWPSEGLHDMRGGWLDADILAHGAETCLLVWGRFQVLQRKERIELL